MNLEIFKKSDPSGKLTRESFLLKNHSDEYNFIINYCIENNYMEIPFKEKVYLAINNIKKLPTCKNPICDKKVKFKNSTIGYLDYCSKKCISSDPNIKKRKEEISMKKYGTKSPSQSNYIKKKIIDTNLNKYGGNSPLCSIDVKNKSNQTLISNYGVDNPSKSKEIVDKRVESFKKSSFKQNYQKSSMEKYGVTHPWMCKDIHIKTIESSKISKNELLKNRIENIINLYSQYRLIDINYHIFKREIKIFCKNCNTEFSINREDFHIRNKNNITICTFCNPINGSKSGSEMELLNFIRENYYGVIENNKKVIFPYEIDIYLPEIKIGFEFNGLYWHSEQQKGKRYHYNKTKMCENNGIELVHIWEDDWVYKNEIVKSIILNKIKKIKNRIFSRNCTIKMISPNESLLFLDNNHIQGYSRANVKIGMYNNDKLVSLMTFKRISIGTYELSRFCNVINTTVVGSFSKLLSFFIQKYNPLKIITYSDNSMFKGDVYKKIGFECTDSPINYKWVINKKRIHKSNFRKNKLKKLGYDISKSENDIVIEDIGGYKIWDCGLRKWIWNSDSKYVNTHNK